MNAPVINISYEAGDSCQIQLWAKGTYEAEQFVAACEERLLAWDGRVMSLKGSPVKHLHWRTVRADAETRACGVCDHVFIESAPGRGAYPVTLLDIWMPLFWHAETVGLQPSVEST